MSLRPQSTHLRTLISWAQNHCFSDYTKSKTGSLLPEKSHFYVFPTQVYPCDHHPIFCPTSLLPAPAWTISPSTWIILTPVPHHVIPDHRCLHSRTATHNRSRPQNLRPPRPALPPRQASKGPFFNYTSISTFRLPTCHPAEPVLSLCKTSAPSTQVYFPSEFPCLLSLQILFDHCIGADEGPAFLPC